MPRADLRRRRLGAVAWLALWIPAYAYAYGAWHFLQLCNLGLLLGVLGLAAGSTRLLASQAVASLGIAVLWLADVGARLASGVHLHGGTAYLWDATVPWPARALSLYHVAWPLLLLACVARDGYDRRGFALQCAIAAAAIGVALAFAPAAENLNYVVRWPGAAADAARPVAQAALSWALLVALLYLPAHALLAARFSPPAVLRLRCDQPAAEGERTA